jgi:hypothetical protein
MQHAQLESSNKSGFAARQRKGRLQSIRGKRQAWLKWWSISIASQEKSTSAAKGLCF